jgi:hypothetical protein
MDTRKLHSGHGLTLVGAGVAFASLWAPWVHVTASPLPSQAARYSPQVIQEIAAKAAALVPNYNGWHVNGNEIAVLGALVVVSVLAGSGAVGTFISPRSAGWWSLWLGGIMALVIGDRWFSHGTRYLRFVDWGVYVALAGSVMIMLGGWRTVQDGDDHHYVPYEPAVATGPPEVDWSGSETSAIEPAPALTPVYTGAADRAGSVAPPGMR